MPELFPRKHKHRFSRALRIRNEGRWGWGRVRQISERNSPIHDVRWRKHRKKEKARKISKNIQDVEVQLCFCLFSLSKLSVLRPLASCTSLSGIHEKFAQLYRMRNLGSIWNVAPVLDYITWFYVHSLPWLPRRFAQTGNIEGRRSGVGGKILSGGGRIFQLLWIFFFASLFCLLPLIFIFIFAVPPRSTSPQT